MMWQCRFVLSKKITPPPQLYNGVEWCWYRGEGCACMRAGGIWETSVPPSPFCCKPKTALKKNKVLKRKVLTGDYRWWALPQNHFIQYCVQGPSPGRFIALKDPGHRTSPWEKWPPQWQSSWIQAFTVRSCVITGKMAVTGIPPSFTSRNWIQLDFFHRKFPLEAGFVFRQRRQKNIGTLPLRLRSLVLLSLVFTVIFKPGFTFGCFPLNPFENALVESFSLNRAFPGFSFRLFHCTFLALPNTL